MTPLEKAARAAAEQFGDYDVMLANKREWIERRSFNHANESVDVNGPFRDDFIDIARAVLMAVREPGDAAINAYFDKCRDIGFTAHINASCAMETMIDAILSEVSR